MEVTDCCVVGGGFVVVIGIGDAIDTSFVDDNSLVGKLSGVELVSSGDVGSFLLVKSCSELGMAISFNSLFVSFSILSIYF